MNYAIVENDTGAILQTGTCDPSQFSVKGWAGVTARECAADVSDDTHEYVDGHFVALPGPQGGASREQQPFRSTSRRTHDTKPASNALVHTGSSG